MNEEQQEALASAMTQAQAAMEVLSARLILISKKKMKAIDKNFLISGIQEEKKTLLDSKVKPSQKTVLTLMYKMALLAFGAKDKDVIAFKLAIANLP